MASVMTAHASTIIIGGATNDGNFENGGAANQDASPTTGGWVTTGTSTTVQIRTNQTVTSGNNTVIGVEPDNSTRFVGRDTGYTIVVGDQFDGGFAWRDKFNWGPPESVDMVLFWTADDNINSARNVIATWNSGAEVTNDVTETEVFGLTAAGSADAGAGRTLFVSLEANGTNANSFARVDDVTLNVTSVPEPASTAFLGLGVLALILRRRK